MVDVRHRTTAGNWFRFLARFLGQTGLLAAAVGGVGLAAELTAPAEWTLESATALAKTTAEGVNGEFARVAGFVFAGGLIAAAVWLLVELLTGLFTVTGRRMAVGINAYQQTAFAVVLFVIVNAYSFSHYKRFDCTKDRQFTLPQSVLDTLGKLDPNKSTNIVVLQLHRTSGATSDKVYAVDSAAERKVVEKVTDLVDQLRELGPRFRVTVLDAQEEQYEDRVDELTRDAPGLRDALEAAPENSILFQAGDRVERMSFSDFYALDKTASLKSITTPSGAVRRRTDNLVLVPAGVEPFARRVAGVGEKKPKIGLAVIHPVLTTRDDVDDYTAKGLRKTLEANGFEVTDVILKKWGRGNPTAAANTYDEFDLDRVEGRYNLLTLLAADRKTVLEKLTAARDAAAKGKTLAEKAAALQPFVRGKIESEKQVASVQAQLAAATEELAADAKEIAEELEKTAPKYQDAIKNEKANEARRVTDVKEKFAAAVADCDLLILPRMTVMDIPRRAVIESWLYSLSSEQAEVVKDFLKAGKPVLTLFGPTRVGQPAPPGAGDEPDAVEKLLTQLGFEFGKQTVVYDEESRAAAERQDEALGGGTVDLPPLVFAAAAAGGKEPNPVAAAFRATARSVDAKLNIKKSGFRPITVRADVAAKQPFAATVMETTREAWNEEKPIPAGDYVPKYEPTKLDDPKKGTPDEERRGPFSVGAALETTLPADWFPGAKPGETRPTVRVVALGHGGLFVGKTLDPAPEKLLLHTLNWQLHRDDLLPHAEATPWTYPRVELSTRANFLWKYGSLIGPPLLAMYFGLQVLRARKVR